MAGVREAVQRGRVLLVEDEEDVRSVVRVILERAGYTVDEACDGSEALARLRLSPREPCIVLLDLMMPNINGWQLLELLGREDRFYALPVCVLSAVPKQVPRGVRFIRKPFALEELIRVVDEHCSK